MRDSVWAITASVDRVRSRGGVKSLSVESDKEALVSEEGGEVWRGEEQHVSVDIRI